MRNFLKAGCFATCFYIFISCNTTRSSKAPNDINSDLYQLVWSDEFDGHGSPDTTKWSFENGFVRNEEHQWYQQQNAWQQNGLLVIEARKELRQNPVYKRGSHDWRHARPNIEFTSASINTSGKYSWLYGRLVMRGKINISDGLWPAWWTLGTQGQWPANGEIDIMEYYRRMLLANIASLGADNKPAWFTITKSVDSLGGTKWAAKFHVWRMDWDENQISLYLDDVLMNRVELAKLVNHDGSGINAFNQPHYMLLNLALGGQNGGSLVNTDFPNRFVIDYVRVYQKKKDQQKNNNMENHIGK